VVAFAGLVQYLDLQQVIDHVVTTGAAPLFVMLDGVTDVRNIGAIARSGRLLAAHRPSSYPTKVPAHSNEEAMKSSAAVWTAQCLPRVNSLLKAWIPST